MGAVEQGDLVAVGVLSGNRNFEGRINPHTRANYLASPPLCIAYAIAGTVLIDFEKEPLGMCVCVHYTVCIRGCNKFITNKATATGTTYNAFVLVVKTCIHLPQNHLCLCGFNYAVTGGKLAPASFVIHMCSNVV